MDLLLRLLLVLAALLGALLALVAVSRPCVIGMRVAGLEFRCMRGGLR